MENPSFNVTLTEGEISVILCQLEEKVASYSDYENECLVVPEIESIFNTLEGAIDDYYDNKNSGTQTPKNRGKQTILRM